MTIQELESFERKIWLTRKSRIKTSERLNLLDFISQFLTCYYSLIIVCLSILNFYPKFSSEKISLTLTIASICLTVITIFVISRNFKERSINLKYNYIKLDEIIYEIKKFKTNFDNNQNDIDNSINKYFKLLETSENHDQWDYLLARSESSDEKLNCWEKTKLLYYHLNNIIMLGFLILFPFVISLLIIYFTF